MNEAEGVRAQQSFAGYSGQEYAAKAVPTGMEAGDAVLLEEAETTFDVVRFEVSDKIDSSHFGSWRAVLHPAQCIATETVFRRLVAMHMKGIEQIDM